MRDVPASPGPITLPRLRGALHPLEALPVGEGWNIDELSDLLVPDASAAEAAVLVPLVPRESSLGVLLTRRTDALRHHPGQVSFPGGRIENDDADRSEEHTYELQSLMRISYAVFCLKKKNKIPNTTSLQKHEIIKHKL